MGQVSDRGLPQWKGKVCERDPFPGEALWEGLKMENEENALKIQSHPWHLFETEH